MERVFALLVGLVTLFGCSGGELSGTVEESIAPEIEESSSTFVFDSNVASATGSGTDAGIGSDTDSGIGSVTDAGIGTDSSSGINTNDESLVQTPDPILQPLSDILLLHGFNVGGGDELPIFGALSLFSGTDCSETWDVQDAELARTFPVQKVLTIGFYSDDINCDVRLPGSGDNSVSTPIEELAYELYQYILYEYTLKNKNVDIVAHSMGGIIARKMLADWGPEINVPRVVTLAAPHGGHDFSFLFYDCVNSGNLIQCAQLVTGSDFLTNLAHNPQSAVKTQWTLISTEADEVIGTPDFDSGTAMNDGYDPTAPVVEKFMYTKNHLVQGFFDALSDPISHSSLVGEIATTTFVRTPAYSVIDNPTTRVIKALQKPAPQ